MGGKLVDVKYYLKKDNKVHKMTKEEYKQFMEELKKEGTKYQCANCKVCDCEKIRYTNIYACEEVNVGLFIRKTYQFSVEGSIRNNVDDTFFVYDCNRFEPFREAVLHEQNIIREEILEIENQILKLEDEIKKEKDEEKTKKLTDLKKLKSEKIKLVTEKTVLERLKSQQKNIREQYTYEKIKKLRLENDEK